MRFTIPARCTPVLAASFLALMPYLPAAAEDGVAADTIVFGQAAVLEGPASALGQGMRAGIGAAFEEVNKKGGVNGRKLKLLSVDDVVPTWVRLGLF
jgi:ABC-type branched-subunit amino acid transport system substrate-binding protein